MKPINSSRVLAVLVAVTTIALCCAVVFNNLGKTQERYEGPEFNLRRPSLAELNTLSRHALEGDCVAAYKVGRHHMYYSLDNAKTVLFFRLASKCPNANAHASLISLLASKPEFDDEVDNILSNLRKLDPLMGESAAVEV